jgi:hypothetical protein
MFLFTVRGSEFRAFIQLFFKPGQGFLKDFDMLDGKGILAVGDKIRYFVGRGHNVLHGVCSLPVKYPRTSGGVVLVKLKPLL